MLHGSVDPLELKVFQERGAILTNAELAQVNMYPFQSLFPPKTTFDLVPFQGAQGDAAYENPKLKIAFS